MEWQCQWTRERHRYNLLDFSKAFETDLHNIHLTPHTRPGHVLQNVSINDINEGIEFTLSKFIDDIKPSDSVDTPEGWNTIQRDMDKFKK